MQTSYQLLGGEAAVRQLAAAFYDSMTELPQAEAIRRMHARTWTRSSRSCSNICLDGWLGGPRLYYEKYGTICLTKPHSPYAIDASHRDQWLLCMDRALERVGASQEIKAMLKEPMYLLADFIRNRD